MYFLMTCDEKKIKWSPCHHDHNLKWGSISRRVHVKYWCKIIFKISIQKNCSFWDIPVVLCVQWSDSDIAPMSPILLRCPPWTRTERECRPRNLRLRLRDWPEPSSEAGSHKCNNLPHLGQKQHQFNGKVGVYYQGILPGKCVHNVLSITPLSRFHFINTNGLQALINLNMHSIPKCVIWTLRKQKKIFLFHFLFPPTGSSLSLYQSKCRNLDFLSILNWWKSSMKRRALITNRNTLLKLISCSLGRIN